MADTEPQHQLDIVLDVKKPHLTWVEDILTLYRSMLINSNGKYKIITERNDLPIRHIFHAGNIVPGKTTVRIGKNPLANNQLTADFANRQLNWGRDIYVQEDTAAILANLPLKPADIALLGLARKSEVVRRTDIELQDRQAKRREITVQTGLDGIAAEVGDFAMMGVIMQDWDAGYGGRAYDGSTASFFADREVHINSGITYELFVTHLATDTVERRIVVGSTTMINLVPTTPFLYKVNQGDKWALGAQSEDLVLVQIKKITFNPDDAIHEIIGDEFIPFESRLNCPSSVTAVSSAPRPSYPTTMTGAFSNCQFCFDATFVSCQGGSTVSPSSNFSFVVVPNSSHSPKPHQLAGNTITFLSGAASGRSAEITAWEPTSGKLFYYVLTNSVGSGTPYRIGFKTGSEYFQGFRFDVSTDGGFNYNSYDEIQASSGCVTVAGVGSFTLLRAVPFSPLRVLPSCHGVFTFSLETNGCVTVDGGQPFGAPSSVAVQSLQTFFSMNIPGSLLTINDPVNILAKGFVNENCVSSEVTHASFGLTIAGSTVIDSLVINLRGANSLAAIGSASPFDLEAELGVFTSPTTHMRASLRYGGLAYGQVFVNTQLQSGLMTSLNPNISNQIGFTAKLFHTDTVGAVHSHGCFSIVFDHAEFNS